MKIALSGIAGSGKDYFASSLINNYNFVRFSFSDQLKEIGTEIFDWLEKDYPPEIKEKPLNITTSLGEKITLSPREIWLKLNFLREIENKLFIRKLKEQLERTRIEDYLISDIRTKEEFDFIKSQGFTTIFIEPDKSKLIHPENDFDKQIYNFKDQFDYMFFNDYTGTSKFENFLKENNIL
jgi:dephospho-CoA kinase